MREMKTQMYGAPSLGTIITPHPMKAPQVIGPKTQKATRPKCEIPPILLEEARKISPEPWDAGRHLSFAPPATVTSMKEIGLEGQGISPNAISDPFPLFTKAAILQMRREIFSEEVLEQCRYSSDFIANMVRGMGHNRAPFTYDAWKSPELIKIVSRVAGVDLVPVFDYEIANINISINDQNAEPVTFGGRESAVAWHYDSFPFVCVTMISECTGMVGGETAIQLPDGHIRKLRGPQMGTAVVMQGRYIQHQALKASGGRERITMITAFRPKSPFLTDETVLTGVRGISNLEELYPQYTLYRLTLLEQRFRAMLAAEDCRTQSGRSFDLVAMRAFLSDQRDYLESMLAQMYEVE